MIENRSIYIEKSADVIQRLGNAAITSYPLHPQNAQAAFIALQPFTLPGGRLLSVELFKILENDEGSLSVMPQIIDAFNSIQTDSDDFLSHAAGLLVLKQAIDQVKPEVGQRLYRDNQDLFENANRALIKKPSPRRFAKVYPPKEEPTLKALKERLERPIADPDAFFEDLHVYITNSVPEKADTQSYFLLFESFEGQLQFNAFYEKLLPFIIHEKASPEIVKSCLSIILQKLQVTSNRSNCSEFLFKALNTLISAKKFELAFAILESMPPFNYSPFGGTYYVDANQFFKQLHQYLVENNHEESCLLALKTLNWFLKNPNRNSIFSRFADVWLQPLTCFQPSNTALATELALLFEQLYQTSDPRIKTSLANRFSSLQKIHTTKQIDLQNKAQTQKNAAIHAANGWLFLKVFLGLSISAGIVFVGLSAAGVLLPQDLAVHLNFFLSHFDIGLYVLGSSVAVSLGTWIFETFTGFFTKQRQLAEQTLTHNKPAILNALENLPANYTTRLSAETNIHVSAWCKTYQIKTDSLENLEIAFELYPLTRAHLEPANDLSLFAPHFHKAENFRDLQLLLRNDNQLIIFLMHHQPTLQSFIKTTLFEYLKINSPEADSAFKRMLIENITSNSENLEFLFECCPKNEIEFILKYSTPTTNKRILDFIFKAQTTFEKFFGFNNLKKLQNFIQHIKEESGLPSVEQEKYLTILSAWMMQNQKQFEAFLSMGESSEPSKRLILLLQHFPQQKEQIIKLFVSLPLEKLEALIIVDAEWERKLKGGYVYADGINYSHSLKHFCPEYIDLLRGLKLIIPGTLLEKEWSITLNSLKASFASNSKNIFILDTLLSVITSYPQTPALSEFHTWLKEKQAALHSQPAAIPCVFQQNPSTVPTLTIEHSKSLPKSPATGK